MSEQVGQLSDVVDTWSPNRSRNALVLGGGGLVGIAWMTGLVIGLRAAGINLSLADRFVGTSAGAIVGAVLAADGDPARLMRPLPTEAAPPRVVPERMTEILAVLQIPGQDPMLARRRAGELALAAQVGDPAAHVARMQALVGAAEWPRRDLMVTAIDITTGELQVWMRGGAASLGHALASSTAVPGVFPPIPIGGRHYLDGGLRSPINADLAGGADLVVILEPLAHVFRRSPRDRRMGSATTISVVPDAGAITAIGSDFFSVAARVPAYDAGLRQAGDAARRLRDFWPVR